MAGQISDGKLIAVDWGTSRLRARLLDGGGAVIAETISDKGIGALTGGHEAAFESAVGAWPRAPAIMAGMVGSRQGWREAAYVPCPTDVAALASAMTRFATAAGREIAVIPGLRSTEGDGDVIRGEETQLVGLLDAEPGFSGACIMPGTHSKWARISSGTITGFSTFMSGELFDLLARRSFLRHSVADPDTVADISDKTDFRRGVERTVKNGVPFAATLFSVRVRYLLEDAKPGDNLAYLSGLVIGGEIAAAIQMKLLAPSVALRIVGGSGLARGYQAALSIAGYSSEIRDGDAMVVGGLAHLARAIGFLRGEA